WGLSSISDDKSIRPDLSFFHVDPLLTLHELWRKGFSWAEPSSFLQMKSLNIVGQNLLTLPKGTLHCTSDTFVGSDDLIGLLATTLHLFVLKISDSNLYPRTYSYKNSGDSYGAIRIRGFLEGNPPPARGHDYSPNNRRLCRSLGGLLSCG